MNKTDPELSSWYMSLETNFLIACPACGYTFPDTLGISMRDHVGVLTCRKCGKNLKWRRATTYLCETIE